MTYELLCNWCRENLPAELMGAYEFELLSAAFAVAQRIPDFTVHHVLHRFYVMRPDLTDRHPAFDAQAALDGVSDFRAIGGSLP